MEIGFIGQGLNLHNQSLEALFDGSLSLNRSGHVAAALAESIADERCRIAVAFAQAEAVRIVQRQLSETAHEIETEVSIGIDFGSTSVGALEALAVSDIETYLFNHNRFTYHPELYHLVGPNFTRTIVGSTNLTTQGLNQNVEAAVVVETNGDDPFLDDISEFLDRIVELRTPLTPELLSDLVDADTIPTKSASDASNRSSTIDTHEWHDHSLPDNILADSSVQATDEAFGDRDDTETGGEEDSAELPSPESVPDSSAALELSLRSEMPPIPEPASLDTTTKQNYYSQLVNDATNQPSRMRRLIWLRGRITHGELKRIFGRTYGYSISGSFGASLNILTDVTGEVQAEGEGPEKQLIWVGK